MPRPASSRSANALLIFAITLGGCHKQPPIVSVPSLLRTHIDLEPGWRLNVVTPLPPSGFERSFYAVTPTGLAWQQSTRFAEGKEIPGSEPAIFPKPGRKTSIRILFLTRASEENHNTALLFGPNPADLEPLTTRVRSNPEQACQAPSCLWIPSRVAVRPEKPNPAGGFTPAL